MSAPRDDPARSTSTRWRSGPVRDQRRAPVAGRHRGGARAAARRALRLPVPARRSSGARPGQQADRLAPRRRRRSVRPARHHARARRARWSVDGRAHVLDGRRRCHGRHGQGRRDPRGAVAGGRSGAARLSPAPAGEARTPAHRAPARRHGADAVRLGRPGRVRHARGARRGP